MGIISDTKRMILKENKKYQKCHQYLFLLLLYASYVLYFVFFLSYSFQKQRKNGLKSIRKKPKII